MLGSLRAQPSVPREVVVVDQSTTPYELESFPELRHFHAPQLSGLTAARNFGLERVTGDVVLFFDDDVVLQTDCVREVADVFARRPDIVGAQCNVRNPWDNEAWTLHTLNCAVFERGFFNLQPRRVHGECVPRLIDGLASAYRRSLFEHERFDEELPDKFLAEDFDFTKRAARHGNLTMVESARVLHLHSPVNRPDGAAYARARWRNVLYLYDKLEAGRDVRNRFWRRWWMLGETLRAIKHLRRA